jgi:lactoylglutathione lyase/glyoxylase I family protein
MHLRARPGEDAGLLRARARARHPVQLPAQWRVFGFYLNCGGRSHVEVFQKDDTRYSDKDQITHFCLEVEDLDAAIAHIESNGVEITKKKYACDDTYQAWIRDPNNVRIELFEYTDQSAQFVGRDRVADW